MTKAAQEASKYTRELCQMAPVVPVIIINRVEDAIPMATALVAGGLPVLEVTLRTPVALEAIKQMAKVPGGVVGAGTVLTEADAKAAKEAGAKFAVSPGCTTKLMQVTEKAELPLLPGVSSATEAMTALERGYDMLKFFPAEQAGGAPFLKSLSSPLPQVSFCPTGGVSPANATQYLSLPNVICVGGSWVVKPEMVANGDWDTITQIAKTASKLTAP